MTQFFHFPFCVTLSQSRLCTLFFFFFTPQPVFSFSPYFCNQCEMIIIIIFTILSPLPIAFLKTQANTQLLNILWTGFVRTQLKENSWLKLIPVCVCVCEESERIEISEGYSWRCSLHACSCVCKWVPLILRGTAFGGQKALISPERHQDPIISNVHVHVHKITTQTLSWDAIIRLRGV